MAHVELQHGIDVGKKEITCVSEFLRNLGIEVSKDAELRIQGLGLVHILAILARPEKTLALLANDTARVHTTGAQHLFFLFGKVISHHGHHADVGEKTCGEGEVRGCAAKYLVPFAVRSLDCVKSDGSNHEQ
jgi:hypothetical protein